MSLDLPIFYSDSSTENNEADQFAPDSFLHNFQLGLHKF